MQDFDIIIVGAGLIGASLVVALKNQGLKIAVLEKNLPDVKTLASFQERPISLAYGSVEVLKVLGVWQLLSPYAANIDEVHVSEQGVLGAMHFRASEQRVDALGYVVPYSKLHLALYEKAAQVPEVDIKAITEITRIEQQGDGVEVDIDTAKGPQQLRAQLMIGCDGANSFVRRYLKIPTDQHSQNKKALTGVLIFDSPFSTTAYERFCKQGVLALLPLPNKMQCGFVWTLPESTLAEVEPWQSEQYINFIEEIFKGRIPKINSITKGAQFPLATQIAKQQFKAHVLLLGNAAHTLYPLAAQGFNLGLRDVAVCAEVLVDARSQLQNLGSDAVLNRYLEWRLHDQRRVQRLTNHVNQVFSLKFPLLRPARGIGLLMGDLAGPLKNRLAKLTLGLSGKLPKLVRGMSL